MYVPQDCVSESPSTKVLQVRQSSFARLLFLLYLTSNPLKPVFVHFISTFSISLLINLKLLLTSFNCLSIFKCAHFKSVCLCVLYVNECGVHLCLNNVLFVFYVVRSLVLSLWRRAETVSQLRISGFTLTESRASSTTIRKGTLID